MRLRIVKEDQSKPSAWKIVAVVSRNGDCDLLDFLTQCAGMAQYRGYVAGLINYIDRIVGSSLGPKCLTTEQCHYVHQEEKIWEFIKGDLRVLWFEGNGRMVICTACFVKKGAKTPRNLVNAAIDAKKQYWKNHAAGAINIEKDE